MIFLTLAQGVNIIYGFTGYLPFGYVGFFGAGAYGFAHHGDALPRRRPLAALVARRWSASRSALLLTPLLRLSGAYFAIANLAASLAVLHLVANPALEDITRGPYGVSLTGVFNPTLAYAAALAILALTLRHRRVPEELAASAWRCRRCAKIRSAPPWPASTWCGCASSPGWSRRWSPASPAASMPGTSRCSIPTTCSASDFSIFAIVFALFGGVATITGPIIGVVALYGVYNLIGFTTPQYFQLIYGAADHGAGAVPAGGPGLAR